MAISSESGFTNDEAPDREEEHASKIDYKEIKKLAEQLHKKHGGELRDWMGEAHRRLLDEHYVRAGFKDPPTIYDYGDGKGKTLYQVFRYDHKDFKKAKRCPIRHKAKDGTLVAGPGLLRVPFRLDLFAKDGLLIYVEGENKVQRLASLGWKATTMAGQKWSVEAAYQFNGQDVVIIPDNDAPGRANAEQAFKSLKGFARSIRIVKLPGLKRSEDIIDWLDTYKHTSDELKALIETARPSGLSFSPRKRLDPKDIPPRDFISKPHYIRKFGSMVVAPGAAGKSLLLIAEAIALASGKQILNVKPARGEKYRVCYICGEDGIEELDRRFTAAMLHYGVTNEDIGDNLFYESGRMMPIKLAQTENGRKLHINEDVFEELTQEINEHKWDVLILDPLIDFHSARENMNEDMDPILKRLNAMAEECNISYVLVHHTRKPSGNALTVDDARGAGSAVNAARTVRVINPMSEKEARDAGISPHRRGFYFSSYVGKANLTPPAEALDWYEKKSINLGNSDDPDNFEGESDNVGVVVSYDYPVVELPTDTPSNISLALAKIRAGGPWRENQQAKDWVGIPIAQALKIDITKPGQKKSLNKRITDWIAKEILKVVTRKDAKGNDRPFVEIGDQAEGAGPEDTED